MRISGYAAARLRLSQLLAGGPKAVRSALHQRFHYLGHWAHATHEPLHAAYLGGVAAGGGYRYAAIGLLICMAVTWLCGEE